MEVIFIYKHAKLTLKKRLLYSKLLLLSQNNTETRVYIWFSQQKVREDRHHTVGAYLYLNKSKPLTGFSPAAIAF